MTETLFPLDMPQQRSSGASIVTWPDWPFGDLVPGAYDVIMADAAWEYRMRGAGGYEKAPQAHYDCLPLDAIKALPVERLAARDCLLWLWTTWPHLANGDAHKVLDAWGFEGRTGLPWNKETKNGKQAFGPGYIVRGCSEPVLLAVRGTPAWDHDFCARTRGTIDAKVREHSRKPDEAYAMAEGFLPHARRADLFSRQRRPNWESWGNQIDYFPAIEATPAPTIVEPIPVPAEFARVASDVDALLEIPAWLRRDPKTGKLAAGGAV